ncbi:MAG: FtsQ-type POTRA domain-containing protein [Gammaproteobacteria bacterium]|nr:FtsQ-type POTRA domain-containing protein [Gammaproteobacteria bacterium]
MAGKQTNTRFALLGKKLLVAVAAFALVSGTGIWFVSHPLNTGVEEDMARYFPLRSLRVEGRFEHVTAAEIQRAVIPFARAGFFGIDLDGARAALVAMPWVNEVRLRRSWPNNLTVRVEEQSVVACWRDKGMVNTQGRVFYPEAGVDVERWPVVDMPVVDGRVEVGTFLELTRLVEDSGRRVRTFSQDNRGSVFMTLGSGVELQLGHQDQAGRLKRFLGFFPSIDDAGRVASVDLRYSNGFAVRRRSDVVHG